MKLLNVDEVLHDLPEKVVKGMVVDPVPLASLRGLDATAAATALLAFQAAQLETKTGEGLDLNALRDEGRL